MVYFCFLLFAKMYAEGRMLVPIPGQLAPAVPAPVPTGITYAQSQAAGPNDRLNEEGGQQQQQQGQSYYDYDRYAQVITQLIL